jgi:hypothetical protein
MAGKDFRYWKNSIISYVEDAKSAGLVSMSLNNADVNPFLPISPPIFYIPDCVKGYVVGICKDKKYFIQFYCRQVGSEQRDIKLHLGEKFVWTTITEKLAKEIQYDGELVCGIELFDRNICVAGKNKDDFICAYNSEGMLVWKQKQTEPVTRIIQLNDRLIATANTLIKADTISIYDAVTGSLMHTINNQLVSSDAALKIVCENYLSNHSLSVARPGFRQESP